MRCIGAIPTPSTEVSTVTVNSGTRANACGLSDSGLVCWGDGYSPPDRPAIAVAIPLVSEYPYAAVVDFTAPTGTTWSSQYAIHRDCKLPVPIIPKCAAGVTGESWSSIAPHASSLVGQRVRVRDRLSVGPQENNNSYWAACSSVRADLSVRDLACEIDRRNTVLGDGLQRLFLTGRNAQCNAEDPSRLCCTSPAFGQLVVATGILNMDNDWYIDKPDLCECDDNEEVLP